MLFPNNKQLFLVYQKSANSVHILIFYLKQIAKKTIQFKFLLSNIPEIMMFL